MATEATVLEAYRRGLITPEQAKSKITEIRQGKPLSTTEKAIGLVGELGQGASFNLIDEAAAGVATPVVAAMQGRKDLGNIYDENLKIGRDLFKRTEAQMPLASLGANVAGGWRTAAGFLGGARNAPQLAGRSGLVSAAYGAGDGEGVMDRAKQAAQGFAIGAPLGYLGGKVADRLVPEEKASPEKLKSAYRSAKEGLKKVEYDKGNFKNLADRVNEEVGGSIFNVTDKSVPSAVQDINEFVSRRPNAYQIDEFRSQLGSDPLSQKLRGIVDDFTTGNAVPTEYRDLYRRAKLAESLQDAMNKGGDSVTQMRTRIRTAGTKARGLSAAEDAAIKRAGSIGIGEGLLRVGKLPAAVLSAATGGMGNPTAAGGVLLGGRLLDNTADAIAKRRAQEALDIILSGGKKGLTYAERFGALTKGR